MKTLLTILAVLAVLMLVAVIFMLTFLTPAPALRVMPAPAYHTIDGAKVEYQKYEGKG